VNKKISIRVKTDDSKEFTDEVNKLLPIKFTTPEIEKYSKFWGKDNDWIFEFNAILVPVREFNKLKKKADNWDYIIKQIKEEDNG